MKNSLSRPSKKRMHAAIGGTIIVALCCFTPILVLIFGAIGLSAFSPYLDYVLLPALALMIVFTFLSYRKWKRASAESEG